MAIYLHDLKCAHDRSYDSPGAGFDTFCKEQVVSDLGWPENVVEQMLWDHGGTEHFIPDYGYLNLKSVVWNRELMPTTLLQNVPTGAFDHGAIEEYEKFPVYWAERKGPSVVESWKSDGTWLVPPLLISRELLKPKMKGWQLVEGRTRVGVLRGRAALGLHVAEHHETWVGRLLQVN